MDTYEKISELKMWICSKCWASGLIDTAVNNINISFIAHRDLSPNCSYEPAIVRVSPYIQTLHDALAASEAKREKLRAALEARPPIRNVNTIGYVEWDEIARKALLEDEQ